MKKHLIVLALIGTHSLASAAKIVHFGTAASYPPFEFIDSRNRIQGFDIDIAEALCQEIQAKCTFTSYAFDSLIPGLRIRRFDAVIAGIDITSDRTNQVLFTEPYYSNSGLFIALKSNLINIADLRYKKVGVQNGTTQQTYLTNKHPETVVASYDSYQNAILDLKNGRLDLVFGDTAVASEWLNQDVRLDVVGDRITDKEYFRLGLGIAVSQNNTDLRGELNAALKKIKQDHTYATLYKKWFQK